MEFLNSDSKVVQYYNYLRFKLKRVNIMLYSFIHDIQFYNKTLTRRKQSQIRATLRVEDIFYQATLLEKDVYNNVLTCYKENSDRKKFLYLEADCGCACHITSKGPVFHNASCVSDCQTSNLSFKNYLIKNKSKSNEIILNSPLLEKSYEPKENIVLSGDTMFSEKKPKIQDRLSSIFSQFKDAISPRIEKLIKPNKEASPNYIDMETGYFESIKILQSPSPRIDMMGCDTDEFLYSYDMMIENDQANLSFGEAPAVNESFFENNAYVLDVISI